MSDIVFNIALGKVGYYAELPGVNDALIAIPIETTGLETDAILRDYGTIAAILAGTNNEQITMGRKTIAGVTSVVDDANNWRDVDATDPVWVGADGNAISKVIVCYDPDTTVVDDATLIPLTAHDFVVDPSGLDVTAVITAGGFYRATSVA